MTFFLKDIVYPDEIIKSTIMMLAPQIFFVSLWKLCRAYRREKIWAISLVGIGLFSLGSILDIVDSFCVLSPVIPEIVHNSLITIGISTFTLGLILIVKIIINMANVDPLTGLYNSTYFNKALNFEVERSKRYELSFSLLFMDLNNFKSINDCLGHDVGDFVLKEVAKKIKEITRATDVLSRYGGDEFLLLMPQTKLSSIREFTKRLEKIVSSLELPDGMKIGISVGIAGFPDDSDNVAQLLKLADNRMYENKKAYKKLANKEGA